MFDQLDRSRADEPKFALVPALKVKNRQSLLKQVLSLSPGLDPEDQQISPIQGGAIHTEPYLASLDPDRYGATRNHLDGAVTRLSPFIRHGVLSAALVRDMALERTTAKQAEKFIQQLTWREYWQHVYAEFPDNIWQDVEPYKTGFSPADYADELPLDIKAGKTGVACIDHFIAELLETGYLHNHARLYLAGYICHWRRVKWQAGAHWFLAHLLDGDLASNNLSWQWVASTFSHKPYYFNLENVAKFTGENIDSSAANNAPLAGSYEALYEKLFPNLEPRS